MYISDLKKIEYPSHLIINGFVGLKNSIIHNKYKSKCLLGPHYQILAKSNLKKNKIKKKYDLLVTFGGYDANNIIDKFCYELEKFSDKLRVKIIIDRIGHFWFGSVNKAEFEKGSWCEYFFL